MSLSTEALAAIGFGSWEELHKDFQGADLLLGNGFSIALSQKFAYESLFKDFLDKCSKEDAEVFAEFYCVNFESIQQDLLSAKRVNEILANPNSRIDELLDRLKSGLIQTIGDNHPRWQEIESKRLERISEQLDWFDGVFTLNYDLFLYHIIMICLDRYRQKKTERPYQDFFWNKIDENFLGFMEYQDYPVYKNVYYLHGALFVFVREHETCKLKAGGSELIQVIGNTIKAGSMPLFVCEGSAGSKMDTIMGSRYLRFAREHFRNAKDTIVIFGASLSDADRHIVGALADKRRNIAMSVFTGDKSQEELQREIHSHESHLARHDVRFFDSSTIFQM